MTRVGAEGDGVAALPDGTPLYLPGTLPGERVRARPVAKRGDGQAGLVEAILEPDAGRVAPPCPHFGACGGCVLQHWQDAPMRAWKRDLLTAALRRAGFATDPAPLVATAPGTRRRVDLALRRQGGGVVVGLHGPRSAAVVDLTACPVLHPRLFALVGGLRAVLPGLGLLRRQGAAVANLLDDGPDLLLRSDSAPTAADRSRLAAFAGEAGLSRIAWAHAAGGAAETVCLLRPPVLTLSGVAVQPPPGAFLQASAAGEAAISGAVLAALPGRLPARARVAELYAGIGTLTFALATRLRVAAFEGDEAAAAALAAAVNRGGLAGRVTVARRDLARQPLSAAELAGFAAVVLDPPHGGAAPQTERIAAARVPQVIYVSCNPAALARDAAMLRVAGYGVTSATPIDQFLWSARLESVVAFRPP